MPSKFVYEYIARLEAELSESRARNELLLIENTQLKTMLSMQEEMIKHIGYNVENMTINMSGGTLVQHADLVQASGEVRVEQNTSIPLGEERGETPICQYWVLEKIREMGIATPEQEEAEMRKEAEKDAKHFAAYLRRKEKAGILHFRGDNKKQILASLQAHFPNMKRYTYNNFIEYF